MTFLVNKYSRCYSRLMERARGRQREADMERHHIVPRSLGGTDERDNLVLLTYREHFIAHHLLVKFTAGVARVSMLRALSCMRCSKRGRGLTARQYAVARWAYREATVGKPSPLKGRPKSQETKAKMSAAWANRSEEYFEKLRLAARNRTPETREKLRINATNLSDETRARRSAAASKRKHTEATREKLRAATLGNKKCVGRVLSAETKEKIGRASRAYWARVREESAQ